MKRWHQFSGVSQPTLFGEGTDEEAARFLANRRGRVVANRYEMTSLEPLEEPVNGAMIVDLVTGETKPERYRRTSPST